MTVPDVLVVVREAGARPAELEAVAIVHEVRFAAG